MKKGNIEKSPLVSIITPSYNQGKFIEDTILSIKNQDYPKIEHIIIDGGSTDETIEILKKYEDSYTLRWISKPDEGHSDAVNKGFKMARGDIIGWLNSDDVYFDKNVVTSIVKKFLKHPELDLIYGDIVFIDEDNLILRVQCVPDFDYNYLLMGCFIEQPAVFFKSTVVKKYKLDINLKIAIDYEYWLRIGKKFEFHHISRIIAADRNHKERISISDGKKLRKESKQIRKEYGQNLGLLYNIKRFLNRIFSGIPRRIKGFILLIKIYGDKDLAFKVKWDNWPNLLFRQFLSTDLKSLLSKNERSE